MMLTISPWITQSMMQSRPVSTMWSLSSVKDIKKEFKEVIGDRIASICKCHKVTVDYAFQDINYIPG